MMFITGPMFSGKKTWVCESLGLSLQELTSRAVWDVQELAATADDLEMLCDDLCQFDIVIATEVGGGIVPVDAAQRAAREAAGSLACLLAARAETVVRICCGLPQLLKGTLPC